MVKNILSLGGSCTFLSVNGSGKGREEFQEIEGNKIPYSDLEIIKSFL